MKGFGIGNANPDSPPSANFHLAKRSASMGSSRKGAPYHSSFCHPLTFASSLPTSSEKAELVKKTRQLSGVNALRYSVTTSGFHSSRAKGPLSTSAAGYLCSDIAAETAKSSFAGDSSLCAKEISFNEAISSKTSRRGPACLTSSTHSKRRAITFSRFSSPSGVSVMLTAKSWPSEKDCEGPAESWSTQPHSLSTSCREPMPSWPKRCAMYVSGFAKSCLSADGSAQQTEMERASFRGTQ
mmetsp:Transcript_96132/g.276152  ORF Transcript_96132/g.276152 Transcript_96132/m.276152 type:complete len:240 (-) Transcript_96132:1316-2035(-)